MLLFFLTGLSFEIKRIIIAFWALVKREIKIFLKNFREGRTVGMGVTDVPVAVPKISTLPYGGRWKF